MPEQQWICFESDAPGGWEPDDWAGFVASHAWVPARAMPSNPHEHPLRRDTTDSEFNAAVRGSPADCQRGEVGLLPDAAHEILSSADFQFAFDGRRWALELMQKGPVRSPRNVLRPVFR